MSDEDKGNVVSALTNLENAKRSDSYSQVQAAEKNMLDLAKKRVTELNGKNIVSATGQKIIFGARSESERAFNNYVQHLLAGHDYNSKSFDPRRFEGLWLAEETLKDPLAVYEQLNNKGEVVKTISTDYYQNNGSNIGQEIVVEVENGRVVTVYTIGSTNSDNALAEIKNRSTRKNRRAIYMRSDFKGVSVNPSTLTTGAGTAQMGEGSLRGRNQNEPFGHSGTQSNNASTGSAP